VIEMAETSINIPLCPYCSASQDDFDELDEGSSIMECRTCGKHFTVTKETCIQFTTEREKL